MIDRTNAGFRWHGNDRKPLDVACIFSTDTHRVVRLACSGREIDVYVSPTGRSMRVFRGGVELKVGEERRKAQERCSDAERE